MNQQPTPELLERYEPDIFKDMPYRLMKPIDFDANQQYPLILSLHGAGGRGKDNLKNLRNWNTIMAEEAQRRKYPCFVVVPQTEARWRLPKKLELTSEFIATLPDVWQERLNQPRFKDDDGSKGDLGKVYDLLDQLAETYPIDTNRVYCLGHSMGGGGTWTAIYEAPQRFAAAIPSAGGFSPWQDIKRITHIPIWAFHGDADPTVPVEFTRDAFRQLKELAGNMKYTELKDVKHNVNTYAFVYKGDDPEQGFVTHYASDQCDKTPDVWEWLFAQTR